MAPDSKRYATEWAEAEIRVNREGDDFKLEIRARDDIGTWCHHFVNLDERDAGELREIWVEIV